MSNPLVEVLTFEGCPHAEPALELARRVVAESGIDATVRESTCPTPATAAAQRFLGSPTIRVNGRDIEPGVERARRVRPLLSRLPHRERAEGRTGRTLAA